MKIIEGKKTRNALAAVLIALLCFTGFFPVIVYADKEPAVNEGGSQSDVTGELPGYALLPDGAPNPAFVDSDGKLITVSQEEYAEIVADWKNPVPDTDGLPTLLELLGHSPAATGEATGAPSASGIEAPPTSGSGTPNIDGANSPGSVGTQESASETGGTGGTTLDPGNTGGPTTTPGNVGGTGGTTTPVEPGGTTLYPGGTGGKTTPVEPGGTTLNPGGTGGKTTPVEPGGKITPVEPGGTTLNPGGTAVATDNTSGSGAAPGEPDGTMLDPGNTGETEAGAVGSVIVPPETGKSGVPVGSQGGISAFAGITPFSVDFPYFFHLAGQTDPYGSGHSFRQYYVPAGSDVPLLSFCLEMGKNAPPDSEKVAYTPMGAPSWSTALATFAPTILNSYGIDTVSDNANRYWAMQDAVWLLTGSGIGAAANAAVIQSLVSAAQGSVTTSNPVFSGFPDEGVLRAAIYNNDRVRYGPFSISGMSGTATMTITGANGKPYTSALLVDANNNPESMSSVPGDKSLYIILPRYLSETREITIQLNAPYILPSTMSAYAAPSSSYQNQLVMDNWTSRSGTLSVSARLGGFGVYEFTKLDAGWRQDYREADYDGDGTGDIYMLAGAVFKIQQWNGSGFSDTTVPVTYDPERRVYYTGFLTETTTNGGRMRIVETTAPYGYRDPVVIEFSIRGKYDLAPGGGMSDQTEDVGKAATDLNKETSASYYILNNLLNVKIELKKRDSADGGAGPARPQGDATLAGAYYGLFYAEAVTDPSGIEREADEIVCIGVTDENGAVVFDNTDAALEPANRKLMWSNSNTVTNYGTEDFPIYLPAFDREDRRIYPAKYYIQEIVPSHGYLLDIDPETAELDINGIPLPGTGTARKYAVDAYDNGAAKNPAGILIETTVTEKVMKRGFLLRKIRSNGNESEILNLDGAGFSVYFVDDLVDIIKKAALADPTIKVPQRGPGGWNKQDFIDFFYEPDYVHPPVDYSGKDWYNHDTNIFKGRYNFELYPELKRARIDYAESPVFYSGADKIPGLSYGGYGNSTKPQDGEVVFPEFPYGEYIVFETVVPPGLERVKPFVVSITEDGGDVADGDGRFDRERPEQGWRLQVDSDMFSIRLWKKDAETGKTVIGKDAVFRIKYLGADGVEGGSDDRWVEMVVPSGSGSVRWGTADNPFRLGPDGVLILPKKLQAGSYKLYEVEAPAGYVLSYHEAVDTGGYHQAPDGKTYKHGYGGDAQTGDASFVMGQSLLYTPVAPGIESAPQPDVGIVFDANEAHRVADFDIDEDGYDDFVLELVQYNEQQKGRVDIHKEREVPEAGGLSPETIVNAPFSGVRFELYAAENILSLDGHGQVLYEKGELVAVAITDADGNAYFKDLYLGLYLLKEAGIDDADKTIINGKLVSGYKYVDDIEIDLRPPAGARLDKGSAFFQENAIVAASIDMLDTWQLGKVEVHKTGKRPGEGAPVEEPLAGVIFEVVAKGDITGVNTPDIVWKDGDKVGTIVTDEEGRGNLSDLLPGDYILRETDAPEGYIKIEDKEFTISPRGHTDAFEWYTWDLINLHRSLSLKIAVEVDKDTIRRTSAAFVSLPGQAGYNNIGAAAERYRYDVNFRSTSSTWADEFVVDDPLENALHKKIVVEELWTPVVFGDHDGLWNLWYATNKTDPEKDYSPVSAMDTNPYNPDNPDRIASYPNTGLKLLAQGLKADRRYHFTLADFHLGEGEYLTHLRYEYGRVEVGFTSRNYSSISLNGEHRKTSGLDLKLPSNAANELLLLDPGLFDAPLTDGAAGLDDGYITGIKGDVVDWTPVPGTRFYAPGAVDPGYDLKPASYLVSAVKAMTDVDIVSSVSARIARDVTMRAYDQDAVVTKEIGTFEYKNVLPTGGPAKTFDGSPLLAWLIALLAALIGLLVLGRVSLDMRRRTRRQNIKIGG